MTTKRSPIVSVLIVTFNSAQFTPRCFAALQSQSMADFEAIVVDNCSSDAGPIIPDDPRFTLIRSKTNLGFAAGNNLAARHATATWLATLNPDAFPEADWLDNLLAATRIRKDVTMVGSLQIMADDPSTLDGAGDCYSPLGIAWRGLYGSPVSCAPPTGEVFGPCAAAALYKTEAFWKVGGFDEAFFCYHEDVDLALRLRLTGGICVQSMEARVSHVGSGISGHLSEFSVFHGTRNSIWTLAKCFPLALLILFLPLSLMAQFYFLLRVRHTNAGAQRRGFWAGLRGLPMALKQRRSVQRMRVVSSLTLARSFTWSIGRLRNHDHDVRPLLSIASQ